MKKILAVCMVFSIFMLSGCGATIMTDSPTWHRGYRYIDPNDYYYQQNGSFYHHHHSRGVDIIVRQVPLGYFVAPRPIHINRPPVIHYRPTPPRHEIYNNRHNNRPNFFYSHPSGPPMIHNRPQLRRPEINIPPNHPSIMAPNIGRPSAPLIRPPARSIRHQSSPNFGGRSSHKR